MCGLFEALSRLKSQTQFILRMSECCPPWLIGFSLIFNRFQDFERLFCFIGFNVCRCPRNDDTRRRSQLRKPSVETEHGFMVLLVCDCALGMEGLDRCLNLKPPRLSEP